METTGPSISQTAVAMIRAGDRIGPSTSGRNGAGMEKKGFFGSLFDFSFTHFVFPKVISFIYGVFVVIVGLAYIAGIVVGFDQGTLYGVGAIVLGPLVLTLYLIMVRSSMEIAIVMFRIYDNTDRIAGADRMAGGSE